MHLAVEIPDAELEPCRDLNRHHFRMLEKLDALDRVCGSQPSAFETIFLAFQPAMAPLGYRANQVSRENARNLAWKLFRDGRSVDLAGRIRRTDFAVFAETWPFLRPDPELARDPLPPTFRELETLIGELGAAA